MHHDVCIIITRQQQKKDSHPPCLDVEPEPAHDSFQDVLLVAHIELLHGEQLTQALGGKFPELLRVGHVSEVRLQELGGDVVNVMKAVMQREETDSDAVLGRDAALQELAAQGLEVSEKQQVSSLDHVLDGFLAQRDL